MLEFELDKTYHQEQQHFGSECLETKGKGSIIFNGLLKFKFVQSWNQVSSKTLFEFIFVFRFFLLVACG